MFALVGSNIGLQGKHVVVLAFVVGGFARIFLCPGLFDKGQNRIVVLLRKPGFQGGPGVEKVGEIAFKEFVFELFGDNDISAPVNEFHNVRSRWIVGLKGTPEAILRLGVLHLLRHVPVGSRIGEILRHEATQDPGEGVVIPPGVGAFRRFGAGSVIVATVDEEVDRALIADPFVKPRLYREWNGMKRPRLNKKLAICSRFEMAEITNVVLNFALIHNASSRHFPNLKRSFILQSRCRESLWLSSIEASLVQVDQRNARI